MVARAYTVAFEGLDARMVEVQCALAPGVPSFSLVGLPDKAVSEAKERVRAALASAAQTAAVPRSVLWLEADPDELQEK